MGFTKEKVITVSAKDFLQKNAVCHAEFEHDGLHYLIQAMSDDDAENPREDDSSCWTWTTTTGAGYRDKGAMSLDAWEEMEKADKERYLWRPLGLYRHSGDAIYVGSGEHVMDPGGWDSGCMGVAYITKKDAIDVWGDVGALRLTKKIQEAALRGLQAEVEEMNMWLLNQVYGVSCVLLETEQTWDCWGYRCSDRAELKRCMRDHLPDGMTEEAMDAVLAGLEWVA
jgi:hypothetical protein